MRPLQGQGHAVGARNSKGERQNATHARCRARSAGRDDCRGRSHRRTGDRRERRRQGIEQARTRTARRGQGRGQDIGHRPRRGEGRSGEPTRSGRWRARGTIQYRDAALGYIRASIPLDKAAAAAPAPQRRRLDVDETVEVPDPRPEGVVAIIAQPALARRHPASTRTCRPATPAPRSSCTRTRPGTAAASRSASSTPASRSTTRACSTTSTGERKIVDWVTCTRSVRRTTIRRGSTWRPGQRAPASRSTASPTPRRPPAPTASALFNERDPRLGGEVGNDVNRDGNPAGSSGIFAVLWNTTTQPGLGRHQPEQQLRRPSRDDRLQGQLRRRLLRHRQSGHGRRRAHAVRRADRRQEARSSTSASSRARTARTSPASPRATRCSAAR